MINLLHQQDQLQKQGLEIITKLSLEKLLNKYGEFHLVGSMEYGLMTWRDIDIDVYMEKDPNNDEYFKIVSEIFELENIKSLTLVDNRKKIEKNRPKSMYIGIKYEDSKNYIWKIDIRLLSKEFVTTDKTSQLINEKITEELREIILNIKSKVHNNPNYHKSFSSVDIYKEVLLNNVKNIDEFKNTYLNKK